MQNMELTVLLIEDNPAEAELIEEYLSSQFELTFQHAQRLQDGLEKLESEKVDILLLDLTLPDSRGLDTFLTPFFRYRDLPIIVLTGLEDEKLAARITLSGAKGFIVKNHLSEELLAQQIKTALETQHMQSALDRMQTKEYFVNEMEDLKNIFDEKFEKNVSLKLFRTIRDDSKEVFDSLTTRYVELVDKYFQVQRCEYEEDLWKNDILMFSYYLSSLSADTHDLLQIHRHVLETHPEFSEQLTSQSFVNDTKNLLLQIFGYTLSIYRNRLPLY